ncbi:MAG: N-acetyl sugar amidotransferase [Rhodospirillales bacterium]
MRYCKECLMPDTRPRVVFDAAGVCNACLTARAKDDIDWDARRAEFMDIVQRLRPKDGPYDCVVPWSGGKDSSMIAHRLKFEFGLNPLLVTMSPLMPNDAAVHNREEMIKLGFDHLMERPNQKVSRRLARRFFIERGDPKLHWNAGVNAVPVRAAVHFNIPLVFYAEHGESEYGGRVLSEDHKKTRDFTEVLEHQVGDDPMNWMDEEIEERDLAPYLYPDLNRVAETGVTALYFAYFFRWSMADNYDYIKDKIDFHTDPNGRTDGTFTDFDSLDDKIDNLYYHMQYVKFGFGRAVRDACRMIQNGRMTRAEGLELARRYDSEFPKTHHGEHLEYLSLSGAEFTETVDKHRNAELWDFAGNQWNLKHPLE